MEKRGPAAASATPLIENQDASTGPILPTPASGIFALGSAAQKPQDGGQGEAASLQEANLARLLALVRRRGSETAAPQRPEPRVVADAGSGESGLDVATRNPFRFQLLGDAPAAVAPGSLRGVSVRVAHIRQVAARRQIIEGSAYLRPVPAFGEKPVL